MTASPAEVKHSEPRERLLRTASGLFYTKGIRAVGVEEVLAEAGVTRATLYRHFGGKDDLIATYLRTADRSMREQVDAVRSDDRTAAEHIRAVAALIGGQITSAGFRGCAFLNAAAEYPDQQSPAHQAVLEHRAWFLETMTELFDEARAAKATSAAQHFVMVRDGAMASGCLADPQEVVAVFLQGVDGLLQKMNKATSS